MTYDSICDEVIIPKLTDMLGKTIAENIRREARFATVTAKNDNERLSITVDKICSDPRFLGMWGTAQAEKQKRVWLGLLS